MDRACAAHARRAHRRRVLLTRAGLLAAAVVCVACSKLVGDPDRIVAIEVVGPQAPTLEVGDTLRLTARALNARGQIVPDAPIVWHVLDTGQVGFTLDTATGFLTAVAPGAWRVQAQVEELTTTPITVTVNEPPAPAPGARRAERHHGRMS